MIGALDALIHYAQPSENTLFLNAQFHPDISSGVLCSQHFKPYHDGFLNREHKITSSIPDDGNFGSVWVLVPKNSIEARYLIAQGLRLLEGDGFLFVAADNKAGGGRLKKWLLDFGFKDIQNESRNKAKVCWAKKPEIDIDVALEQGREQFILNNKFLSQPGIFGWNKIDKGSEILTQHLPDKLSGKGADFGCGYGYLSDFLLQKYDGIKKLYCADADIRAVNLCERNLSSYVTEKEFLWCDLTIVQNELRNLDFVVMNPPFHDGKAQSVEIGQSFVRSAHESLRRNGKLYLVANAHLPYEVILEKTFFDFHKIIETNGFKVFEATK